MNWPAIDAVGRTVLPRTSLIVPSLAQQQGRAIEDAYAEVRRRARRGAVTDALAYTQALVTATTRERQGIQARELLRTRKRDEVLLRAVSRMNDVDLDSAWRAALRGDSDTLDARVLPHVTAPRKRTPKGSPWRSSGWLSKRAR